MNDLVTFHESLPALVLSAHRDEYDELNDTWQRLDAKAQGTATIAGVFLAAAFAFLRDLPSLTGFEKSLLTAGIAVLVAAIAAAIRAAQIREVLRKPVGEDTEEIIRDAAARRVEAEAPQRIAAFFSDQADLWRETNDSMRSALDKKTFWTKGAQFLLLGASGIVALLSTVAVWR